MKKLLYIFFGLLILSCSEDTINNNNDITEPPTPTLDFEVFTNVTQVPTQQETAENISRTFYDVSGTFVYGDDDTMFAFYSGTSDSQGNSIEDVLPVASQVLIKVDNTWEFFKTDDNLKAWGMRNFEILENEVIIGDGNEIGADASTWKGDVYIGQILNNGDISWRRVNEINERGFFHGTCAGDLNNDGLTDVGVTPGLANQGVNIFIQNQDGSFTRSNELLDTNGAETPFTLDFADLTGDGIDEIITADYGGGGTPDEDAHEIRIYKYNSSVGKFELHFQINEPNIYDVGLGATSIKIEDFTNDGILDIAVAREDISASGFEVWKGTGNAEFEFVFSSPSWTQNELQFREFSVLDVNNDGSLDIILRPFHYGTLYRNSGNCWWNVDACNGIKLNHLIWINNGNGYFDYYNDKDLTIEGLLVDSIHPYMQNETLHFVGTFSDNPSEPSVNTVDIKVNL